MRISDWSSDVCSSDLQGRSVRVLIPFVLRSHRPLLSAVTTRSARARFLFSVVPLEAHAGLVGASAGHLAFQGDVRRQLDFHRSEEHTSELQSLMRISYAVFCLKKKNNNKNYIQ